MRRLSAAAAVGIALTAAPTFTPLTSGVRAGFRGVSAVSDRVVWASGANGTVLRTIDAGATWERREVPDAARLDFRDIDAFSDRVAYILSIGNGETSRIYKTVDGGATWTLQLANQDPKVFLDAMGFFDEKAGIAFSDSSDGQLAIFTTSDGGAQWTRIPPATLPAALPGEGAFAASGTNVVTDGQNRAWIATGSRVLRSTDRGRTWSAVSTPIASGTAAGIFSIAFRDSTHGVIVGGDYQKDKEAVDNVALTSDGGATWTLVRERGLSGFRSVVQYVPGRPDTLVAIGTSGSDWSQDGGKTWSHLDDEGYHTLTFAPRAPIAWAAGAGGRIARLEGF